MGPHGRRLAVGATLLLGGSAAALMAATPAAAQSKSCPSASSMGNATCTVNAGDGVQSATVDFTGANGSGSGDGSSGGTYTLVNNQAITSYARQDSILFLRLNGGHGSDDKATHGGDGGTVTLTNNAAIQLYGQPPTSGGTGSASGVWDDSGFVAGAYVAGVGGRGGNQPVGVGGGDGGNAGRSGEVTLDNSAGVTVSMGLPYGGAGLFASAVAGSGGNQDGTVGDQVGGDAGDGRFVTITSSGAVQVTATGAGQFVWGIGAEGLGGVGGNYNGVGGEGPATTVTSTGAVGVTASGSNGFPLGVRGIYASSVGGPGRNSEDGSDYGGRGEEGKQVLVTVGADVTVTSSSLRQPDDAFAPSTLNASTDTGSPASNPQKLGQLQQSGGIVSFSKGGDGGAGPQAVGSGKAGGTGAAAGATGTGSSIAQGESVLTLDAGATVTTSGAYLPGLFSLSAGGLGGAGREDSNGANGGYGGDLEISLQDGASVSTDGTMSHGIVGRSVGGSGGQYVPSSGFVDFSPNYAGTGGRGGLVAADIGLSYDSGRNAWVRTEKSTITTRGAQSTGLLLQSFGGQGGATGDSFELLGQPAASTGYAGTGGAIGPSTWVDISTEGDYSRGMVLQSVGGGGGTAGSSGGLVVIGGAGGVGANGGVVDLSHAGSITTKGTSATAILGQSIGGGGGASSSSAGAVTIGGQAGVGGAGGSVGLYTASGTMTTSGDYAYGIVAQSVGGGGGDGGDSFSLSAGSIPSVAIGGNGGAGGNGGTAIVSSIPRDSDPQIDDLPPLAIVTHGDNAHGAVAQSIGGGGGTGGDADGGGLTLASLQMAGGGNSGGTGNTATVSFDGASVSTSGSHAMGVLAQSIGGGGGSGGSAYSFSVDAGFALSVGVGGLGGSGGSANTAKVSLTGTTVTTGTDSGTDAHGIVAQSIGGGGGNGGSSVARAIAKAVDIPDTDVSLGFAASAAVGGKGGSGGNGARAEVDLANAAVLTRGDGAMGVIAQSVGGGGGNGGSASSAAGVLGGEDSVSATLSFAAGASGGSGGTGGAANFDMDGTSSVESYGDHGNAVLVQSIGGGGGNAGGGSASTSRVPDGYTLNATFALGAPGGQGHAGGAVDASVAIGARITTHGSGARGLLAQSVGGGGGTAQGGTFGVAGNGDDTTVNLSVALGRNGASGGNGGTLTAGMYGGITTSGGDSDGVMLQSIGGGGGLAGSAASEAGSDDGNAFGGDDESTDYRFSLAIGGTGGTGSGGGAVSYTHGGQVATSGAFADGVVVQSIGGGGGSGGSATAAGSEASADYRTFTVGGSGGSGGSGGAVSVGFDDNHNAQINTTGYAAHGVVAQSIGGGGGQGGDGSAKASGTIGLGGNGSTGPAEDGGTVSLSGFINLSTHGDDAHGIVAQSIGGGGGIGMSGAAGSGAGDRSFGFTLGGGSLSGGATANGKAVSVTVGTNLNTYGNRAFGIVAQSIGGGGGIGGAGVHQNVSAYTLGNGTGSGGSTTVHLTSNSVTTRGAGSHGIVAQSIGGGGGIVGDPSWRAPDLTSEFDTLRGVGAGGTVSVTLDGSVTTSGAYAHGVFAQSIGSGGGLGGSATGATAGATGGSGVSQTVSVTANRPVTASGTGSYGIFAQSMGAEDNAAVQVSVASSVSGGAAGIMVAAGVSGSAASEGNRVTVTSGGHVSGTSNTAIIYQGDTTVSYSGLDVVVESGGSVSGNILGYYSDGSPLTVGSSTAAAARALAAPSLARISAVRILNRRAGTLGNANRYLASLRNAGTLLVGDGGRTRNLRISGDFVQTATGSTAVTADFAAARASTIAVAGNASLSGALLVRPVSVARGVSLAILTHGGTPGQAFDTASSALFGYDQEVVGNTVRIRAGDENFERQDLGIRRQPLRIAHYLGDLYRNGDDGFGYLFGELDAAAGTGADSYSRALLDLAPGATLAAPASNVPLSDRRLGAVLECPRGEESVVTDRYCAGLTGSGGWIDQDSSDGAYGFDGHVYSAGIAGTADVAPGWRVGATLGYERGSFGSPDGFGSSKGNAVVAGVGVGHSLGSLELSAALSVTAGTYDTERDLTLAGESLTARASQDAGSVAARLRAAWTAEVGRLYLRPALSLDAIRSRSDGYTESGAGVLDLTVSGAGETIYRAIPEIEVGRVMDLDDRRSLRVFAGLGGAVLSNGQYGATAAFVNADPGAGTIDSNVAVARRYATLKAGVELTGDERHSLVLGYAGAFGSGLTDQAVTLALGVRF